ncbi:MAG: PAS domain-containing protein [Bacteroidia bacterium]
MFTKNITTKEELEELHEKMIQEIQDYAIILLDREGTILSWNKGVEKIKGYAENEILGQNFSIFYLPQDRQSGLPNQLIDLAKKEGRAKHIGRRVRKDGTTFWGSIVITALHNDAGEVIGFTKLTRELKDHETD